MHHRTNAGHPPLSATLGTGRLCGGRVILAASSVALLGLLPAAARAADPPKTSNKLEEIVVTAEKRSARVNKVPMSVTVATGVQLRAAGIKTVADLVKITPSLSYSELTPGLPIYTLRGIGFSDVSVGGRSTVAVYTDEAPLTFPVESLGGNLDLARVEVLKGPQGILFGQNATGGAINYIAAKPTSRFEAGSSVSYGNYNAVDVEGFVSGPLTDTLLARVAVEHTGMDGWQQDYVTGAHNGAGDFTNARLLLDWKPVSQLHVQLNVNGFVDHSEVEANQFLGFRSDIPFPTPNTAALANYPISPATDTAAGFDPNTDYHRHNNFVQGNLRVDYTLPNDAVLTSLTSYSHYDERQIADLDGTALEDFQQMTNAKIESISQELRVTGTAFEKANYLLGVSYAHDRPSENDLENISRSTTAYSFVPLGAPAITDFRDLNTQDENTYAVFGNLQYQIDPSVKIYGGARYTRSENQFSGCTADAGDGAAAASFGGFQNVIRSLFGLPPNAPIPAGGCTSFNQALEPALFHARLNQDNVSWRAGADWSPTQRTLLYANVTKGFKAGGFPILAASENSQFGAATQESVIAYEAGFKVTLLDRTLQLNGAGFYYDYNDKQVLGQIDDAVLGPVQKLINIPKSRILGSELQLAWSPVAGLNINGGGSYISSTILNNFTNYNQLGAKQNFAGEPFPNTPRWQLNAGADYRMPLSERLEGFIGGNVQYQSATNSELGELSITQVRARALVDLRGGVQTSNGKWRLSLWCRNVGNTYYWLAANKDVGTIVRYPGMPRTFGLTLEYQY